MRYWGFMGGLLGVVNVTCFRLLREGHFVPRNKIVRSYGLGVRSVYRIDSTTGLRMSETEANPGFDLEAWFNPNTRGGVIVWSTILTIIPVLLNNALVESGMDADEVGAYVGFAFVCLSMVGWASTYLFRVANKDMTYATQLREYENAVLEKRLEELADDEIQALLEEIEDEDKS